MHKFLIRNTDGKKSLTATAFAMGFIIVNVKFLFAGMSFGALILSPFTGVEYAAAVAGLGGVYVLRRQNEKSQENKEAN
jgi:hypothetical protein